MTQIANFQPMTKEYILTLKNLGYKSDSIYMVAAGDMGLYGIAFFGHKGSKTEKAKLKRTWKRILTQFPNHV